MRRGNSGGKGGRGSSPEQVIWQKDAIPVIIGMGGWIGEGNGSGL